MKSPDIQRIEHIKDYCKEICEKEEIPQNVRLGKSSVYKALKNAEGITEIKSNEVYYLGFADAVEFKRHKNQEQKQYLESLGFKTIDDYDDDAPF